MIRPKIYVAHVYGRRHGLTNEECEKNTWLSICVGRELIKKGWNPFIPNIYHFVHKDWDDSPEETIYFDLVSSWIENCQALLVARRALWEGGVEREEKIAKNLCKDVYLNLADVPDYSLGRNYDYYKR
jgi:hypothetical protein